MLTRNHYKDGILYKCNDCGHIFDEYEKIEWEQREYRGECWGQDSYEIMHYEACPNCSSDDFDSYYEEDEETDTE